MGGILTFIKNRSLRLLLPYLVFSFLSLGLRLAFSAFTRSSVDLVTSTYQIFFEGKFFWFLYVLFMVNVLMKQLKAFTKDLRFALLISVALYILGLYLNTKFLCLDRLGYFSIWTVMGCYLYENKELVNSIVKKGYVGIICMIVFAVMYILPAVDNIVLSQLVRYLKAITGVFMTYCVCLNFEYLTERIKAMLVYFGNYSLQYYLIHMVISLPVYYIVAKIPLPLPVMSVFANFILITFLSYIIVTIILKIKWTCLLVGLKK